MNLAAKESKSISPWIPCFFRASDRTSWCDDCRKKLEPRDMIFYFPKLRKADKKGMVFCLSCFIEKVKAMSVVEVL